VVEKETDDGRIAGIGRMVGDAGREEEDAGREEEDAGRGVGGPDEPGPELRSRLRRLCEEGRDLRDRFAADVRKHGFHPFVAADYEAVLAALVSVRAPGLSFLEWGSATGVITIMADLLGFDAYGIEIDGDLVERARCLARRTGSGATFSTGSFLPEGYTWTDPDGDHRLGTIGRAESGYPELGRSLEDFDVVFGYPWAGEEPMMLHLMRTHGGAGTRLLVHGADGVTVYRDGRRAA